MLWTRAELIKPYSWGFEIAGSKIGSSVQKAKTTMSRLGAFDCLRRATTDTSALPMAGVLTQRFLRQSSSARSTRRASMYRL